MSLKVPKSLVQVPHLGFNIHVAFDKLRVASSKPVHVHLKLPFHVVVTCDNGFHVESDLGAEQRGLLTRLEEVWRVIAKDSNIVAKHGDFLAETVYGDENACEDVCWDLYQVVLLALRYSWGNIIWMKDSCGWCCRHLGRSPSG